MIRLHHVPFSRSFRVLWLLEELGLDYDVIPYSLRDGSLREPAFLAISPAGRVPALEMNGTVLFESGAIVQSLCEAHSEAGFAPEPGTPERGRYLEMLGYAETMASLIESLNLQRIFLRDPSQASAVVIRLVTARLRATLAGLDEMLSDDGYLLDAGFSGADAMMGFNVFAAPYYVKFDPFPRLTGYRDRLSARPAYQRARARDGAQEFYTQDFYPMPEV